jgi:hypothetical protein
LVSVVLLLLHRWADPPAAWAIGFSASWLLKDFALDPLLRNVFSLPRTRPELLMGARTLAQERLAPRGLPKRGALPGTPRARRAVAA